VNGNVRFPTPILYAFASSGWIFMEFHDLALCRMVSHLPGLNKRRIRSNPSWRCTVDVRGVAVGQPPFSEALVSHDDAKVGNPCVAICLCWCCSFCPLCWQNSSSARLPLATWGELFPARKAEPWLGWKGLTVVGVLFILSAVLLGVVFRRVEDVAR
jgi:hypothetical protein